MRNLSCGSVLTLLLTASSCSQKPEQTPVTVMMFQEPNPTSMAVPLTNGDFSLPSALPNYETLCSHFGFEPPHSLYQLLEAAYTLNPENPSEAYDRLGLIRLLLHDPAEPLVQVTSFPAFVPFASDGGGGTFGMIAVSPPGSSDDFLVGYTNYVDGPEAYLQSMNFPDFVCDLLLRAIEDHDESAPIDETWINALVNIAAITDWNQDRPYYGQPKEVEQQLIDRTSPLEAFAQKYPGVDADSILLIE